MKIYLPPHQKTALELIAQGLKNKEIAQKMGISTSTVQSYIRELYIRIGIAGTENSRAKARIYYLNNIKNQRV